MTMAAQPSFEYLLSASTTSLESLQLSRLDQIAALKSQIHDAVEAWATAELDVRLTRLILETRLVVSEPQHRVLAQLHCLSRTMCCPIPHAADVLLIHPRPPVVSALPPRLSTFSPSHSAPVRYAAARQQADVDVPASAKLPIAA
jgi:hypothetical protein